MSIFGGSRLRRLVLASPAQRPIPLAVALLLLAIYTQRVAQAWGVGTKERRNGVLLFIFIEDRKMFIQIGYGLEAVLPDATAFDITEYRIKPHFRANDYEGGLAVGIDSIFKAVRGEYEGSGKTIREQSRTGGTQAFVSI